MEMPVVFCPVSHRDEQGGSGSPHEHAALCHVFPIDPLPKAVLGEV